MKKIYLLAGGILCSCFATKVGAQVNVTSLPTASYTNLTTAFAAINAGTHQGAVTIDLTGNINEGSGTATLNPSTLLAPYTSVTIRPVIDNVLIEGDNDVVIMLKGADNVTIDGDNPNTPNTSREITIRNNSIGGGQTCVRIASSSITDGATGNTLRNCVVEGVDKVETSYGIISGSFQFIGLGADAANIRNTIDNNLVRKCRDGIVIIGGGTLDSGWVISNNVVGEVSANGLGFHGIAISNSLDARVSDNLVQGVESDVSSNVSGISLTGLIAGAQISGNHIYDIRNTEPNGGYGAAGIFFQSNSSLNNRIYNNEIGTISSYGDPLMPTETNNHYGIVLADGDGIEVMHNTIYMSLDPIGPDGFSAALYIGSAMTPQSIKLQNNILYNEASGGTNYCIYNESSPSLFSYIDYNLYYNEEAGLLSNMSGIDIADLATWRQATQKDTGSVSGAMMFTLTGDDLSVNVNDSTCWFVNGRGMANTAYSTDINGFSRNTTLGFPTDIGSREFTPPGSVEPPMAIASAAPAVSTITTYTSAGRVIAEIQWGANGTVPTDVYVQYYSGIEPPLIGLSADRIHSYWDIDATGGTGFDYQLKLKYTKAEDRNVAAASVTIIRDSLENGSWVGAGGNAVAFVADGIPVEWSGPLAEFGFFSIGNIPLGLELLQFSAKNNNTVNDLNWATASEKNMSHFEIMRSADGINFSAIGSAKCRNEFMNGNYTFRDMKPMAGYNYYKLKIVETTGESTFSNTVAVKNGGKATIDITSIYPNPATDKATINVYSANEGQLSLEVTDLVGRTVLSQQQAVSAGSNNTELNISMLAPGVYSVKAILAGTEVSISKLVKQ